MGIHGSVRTMVFPEHGILKGRWIIGQCLSRWWFQIFFIFIPTWGNDPIWLITNIFQMGWNHQPAMNLKVPQCQKPMDLFRKGLKLIACRHESHWPQWLLRKKKIYILVNGFSNGWFFFKDGVPPKKSSSVWCMYIRHNIREQGIVISCLIGSPRKFVNGL